MSQTTDPKADKYFVDGLTFVMIKPDILQFITWTPLPLGEIVPFVVFGQDSLYELNMKHNCASVIGRKNPKGSEIVNILKHLMSMINKTTITTLCPKVIVYLHNPSIIERFPCGRETQIGCFNENLGPSIYEYKFKFKCDERLKLFIQYTVTFDILTINSFDISRPPQGVQSYFPVATQPAVPPPTPFTQPVQPFAQPKPLGFPGAFAQTGQPAQPFPQPKPLGFPGAFAQPFPQPKPLGFPSSAPPFPAFTPTVTNPTNPWDNFWPKAKS